MGVQSKIYGMAGITLSYEKGQELLNKYWDDDNFRVSAFDNKATGTYRIIADGMSGEYVRVGLVLFENDCDNSENIDFFMLPKEPQYEVIKHNLKSIFGLDIDVKDINVFVFTHYS